MAEFLLVAWSISSPPFFLINRTLILFQAPGLQLNYAHFQTPLQLEVAEGMLLRLSSVLFTFLVEAGLQGRLVTADGKHADQEDCHKGSAVQRWKCGMASILEAPVPALFAHLLNFYVVGEINSKLSYCWWLFSVLFATGIILGKNNILNKIDSAFLFIFGHILIKWEVALNFCPDPWILVDLVGKRHWSIFSYSWSNCFPSRRKNNRHHLDKGNEFIIHPNAKE